MNKQTLNKILDKKELRGIPENFVNKIVTDIISDNEELYTKLQTKEFNEKSKEFDEFKKLVRQKLRMIYGVFQSTPLSKEQKDNLINKLKKSMKEKDTQLEEKVITKILLSHLSTKERIKSFYSVYKNIIEKAQKTGEINSVADIACGYNPFSYFYWNKEIEYLASDITKEDMNFVQEFFELKKIKGNTIAGDLTDENFQDEIVEKIKDYDVCLLFKALDSLESLKKGTSTILLQKIPCKNIVISFPTGSISGKNKITSKRKWFQQALKLKNSAGWDVSEFYFGPEIYYHLTRS